jgi:hypothetical protein
MHDNGVRPAVKVVIDGSGPGRGVEIRLPHVLCSVLRVRGDARWCPNNAKARSVRERSRERVPIMAANIMPCSDERPLPQS